MSRLETQDGIQQQIQFLLNNQPICIPIKFYNTQWWFLELSLTQILGLMASLRAATPLILLEKHTSLR